MVKLHVKRGDDSQFMYEADCGTEMQLILRDCATIFNGRLKVDRICGEMEELAKHGVSLPPNMQGLADEQITDLKLVDEWGQKCQPSGGVKFNKDKIGCRNGQAPMPNMAEVLTKTIKEAKDMISKKKVASDEMVTQKTVQEALDILRGAVTIVWPMGLPPHDPVKQEFDNQEDLSGKQASNEVIDIDSASMWWAGKELLPQKKLGDFVGKNEKTKIVAKLQKRGGGAPAREKVVSEEDQKSMMAYYYKKQEEMKKLEANQDDSFMDAAWADNGSLKRQFQGLNNVKWGPR